MGSYALKGLRSIGVVLALIGVVAAARLALVQHRINSAPVIPGDLSDSGYTPPGAYGHGSMEASDRFAGWVLYDLPTPDGRVRKVCAQGAVTESRADIDFVTLDGRWNKLRSGTLVRGEDSRWRAEPEFSTHGRILRSRLLFNIDRPDAPYRAKILWAKLRHGTLSPRDYVRATLAGNPSCAAAPRLR